MALPIRISLDLMQTRWASELNPLLANPTNNVLVLRNVNLLNGVNVLNHLLGQMQQGWFLVDKQGAGDVYRTAPFSSTTLTLTSTAAITVSIGVF